MPGGWRLQGVKQHLSLTEQQGSMDSSFPTTLPTHPSETRLRYTIGVLPAVLTEHAQASQEPRSQRLHQRGQQGRRRRRTTATKACVGSLSPMRSETLAAMFAVFSAAAAARIWTGRADCDAAWARGQHQDIAGSRQFERVVRSSGALRASSMRMMSSVAQ